MRRDTLLSHDDVREIISNSIIKASAKQTDEEFGNTIDASASAVTTWRNRKADMGSYFLANALKQHPAFLAEFLGSLGYKPLPLTEAEMDDREFTIALASLQLKQQRALIDGVTDHNELVDMEPELDQVGDGVERRRAKVRRLRSVK